MRRLKGISYHQSLRSFVRSVATHLRECPQQIFPNEQLLKFPRCVATLRPSSDSSVAVVVAALPLIAAGGVSRSRELLFPAAFHRGEERHSTSSSFDGVDPFASEYEQHIGSDDVLRAVGSDHNAEGVDAGVSDEISAEASGSVSDDSVLHASISTLLHDAIPLDDPAATQNLMREAKHSRELRRVLETVVYRSALAWDVLNGHGYRVAMIQTLTSVAPRCHAVAEWIDCLSMFRPLGFQCDRVIIAEGINLIRAAALNKFQTDGRHPAIISDGLNRLRLMLEWSCEDNIQLDHVFFARLIAVATTLVSLFDRQNVYRANFPDDFNRRDGIVFEWVLGASRSTDYDQAVFLCNQFVEEVLLRLKEQLPTSRYSFGLFYRLMDYYFATDQPEKMLSAMEDSPFPPAESSTAKLMQLACAFNLPNVPELFLKFRALPPQCVLASPDMSRLLFYYARAGGGKPCPECGERFNHRHPGLHIWEQTPEAQKRCHHPDIFQNRLLCPPQSE
jgi:hypothetical protein